MFWSRCRRRSRQPRGQLRSRNHGTIPFPDNTSHHLVRVGPINDAWLRTRTEIAELVFERLRRISEAVLEETDGISLIPILMARPALCFEQAVSIRRDLTLTLASPPSSTALNVKIPCIHDEKIKRSRYYSLSFQNTENSRNIQVCLSLHGNFANRGQQGHLVDPASVR